MNNKSYLISKGMNPNPSLKELRRLLGCVKAFQDICMVIDDIEYIDKMFGDNYK